MCAFCTHCVATKNVRLIRLRFDSSTFACSCCAGDRASRPSAETAYQIVSAILHRWQPDGEIRDAKHCIVCYDAPRNTMLRPCRHELMCSECSEKARAKKNVCPLCQTEIEEVLKNEAFGTDTIRNIPLRSIKDKNRNNSNCGSASGSTS